MSAPTPYYQDDAVTIYHGDCREWFSSWFDMPFALVFADPPYGVGMKYGADYEDDYGPDFVEHVAVGIRCAAPVALVTPGMRHFWSWPQADWMLSWHKPGSTRRSRLRGFNTWEPILIYGKVTKPVWQDSVVLPACVAHRGTRNNIQSGDTGDHPAPKPLRLMSWLIEQFSEPDQLIADPFMGSGTTLRAAKDLGRKAIGIEISEAYCEIAAKRMGQEVLDFGVPA